MEWIRERVNNVNDNDNDNQNKQRKEQTILLTILFINQFFKNKQLWKSISF